jgi:hypothetical protein
MDAMLAFAQDTPTATDQTKAVESLVNKAASLINKDDNAAFNGDPRLIAPGFFPDWICSRPDHFPNLISS